MKLAWISTYRTQCGLATYIEWLAKPLSELIDLKIFAENIIPPATEIQPIPQNIGAKFSYERCWDRRNLNYNFLLEKLSEFKPDVVHINFVAGIFNELNYNPISDFQLFIKHLRWLNGHTNHKETKIVITLHDIPLSFPNPTQLSIWYKSLFSDFIVFNPDTVKALANWGCPRDRILQIPHATWEIPEVSKREARQKLGLKDEDFLLTQVGFYGLDKGMLELIKGLPKITIPNVKLVFAGGLLQPTPDYNKEYVKECIKTAIKLGLQNKVIFLGKFLSDEKINLWCNATDFLVLNSNMIWAFSTSGSVHRIMGARKPLLVKDNPRLSEFTHGEHCIKFNEDNMTERFIKLYNDINLQKKIIDGITMYSKETSFEKIAKRYVGEVYR